MSAPAVHAREHQMTAKADRPELGTVCNSGEPRAERQIGNCSHRTRSSSQNPATRPPNDCGPLRFPVFEYAMGIYSPFRRERSVVDRSRICAVVPRKLRGGSWTINVSITYLA